MSRGEAPGCFCGRSALQVEGEPCQARGASGAWTGQGRAGQTPRHRVSELCPPGPEGSQSARAFHPPSSWSLVTAATGSWCGPRPPAGAARGVGMGGAGGLTRGHRAQDCETGLRAGAAPLCLWGPASPCMARWGARRPPHGAVGGLVSSPAPPHSGRGGAAVTRVDPKRQRSGSRKVNFLS